VGLRFGRHHVRTLANMEDVELVAVADRSTALPGGLDAYARAYGATAYRQAADMMEHERLDALCVCVSPVAREQIITSAAQAHIPMFIEKPWAADMAQARRLAAICREHSAVVMVGFSFRFLPTIVRLRALLAADLGAPWLLNGEYVFDWRPPADAWLWDPQNGNGFFNENSGHLFDAVTYLMGRAVSVSAEGGIFAGSPSEDAAAVVIRFESGAIAALTLGGLGAKANPAFPRIDLVTANGQAHLAGRHHIWESLTWAIRDDDEARTLVTRPEQLGDTRYTLALRHFFDCIRDGRAPEATIEDGVRAVALAEAVYQSARTGEKVLLST
jgi:predicted dehydrogenase